MTNEREKLVERLRPTHLIVDQWLQSMNQAADQIEADGKRIAELEAELDLMEQEAIFAETDAAKDAARISMLEGLVRGAMRDVNDFEWQADARAALKEPSNG